jgi:serine/threonine protein kinase
MTTASSESSEVLCPECGEAAQREAGTCGACGEDLRLNGRYLLTRVLGANVGTTYLAQDLTHLDKVVIKELAYGKLDAWKTEELFQREIRVLRQLDHPLIPDYLDHFPLGQGKRQRQYLIQQYLQGESLREELEHRRYNEAEVLEILDGVLSVLEYLQELRPPLIHRDLKPSNLLRLPDGRIALIDFGAVKDLFASEGDNPTVAGTFGFMAPEQFQGEATLQTDLYALGVVALNLLSRTPPEKMLGTSMQLQWREHVEVSAPVERLLDRLLQAEAARRPASAAAARDLLREVREELRQGRTARPSRRDAELTSPSADGAPEEAAPARRSNRGAVVLIAVITATLILGIVGFSIFLLTYSSEDLETPSTAEVRTRAREATRALPSRRAPRAARTPARAPTPAPSSARMALDLSQPELRRILASRRWKGTLNGELVFTVQGEGLVAQLVRADGSRSTLQATTGPRGTVTLVLRQRVDNMTDTHTFYGALTADHRTLKGTHERVKRSGGNAYETQGSWHVNAQ